MRTRRVAAIGAIALAVAATSASALSTRDRISHAGLGPIKPA